MSPKIRKYKLMGTNVAFYTWAQKDNKGKDGEGGILHVLGLTEQMLFEPGRVNHEDT